MAKSLAELQKKDPEFYKYLQENDADLLEFDAAEGSGSKVKKAKANKVQEDSDEDDEEMEEFDGDSSDDEDEPDFEGIEEPKMEKISVTMNMLRGWQRAMIEVSISKRIQYLIPHSLIKYACAATVASFSSAYDPGFPSCCAHERGRL